MGANYSIVFSGSNAQGVAIAVGDLVIPSVADPSSYVVATIAALAGRRPEAVATTAVGARKGSFQFQQTGTVPASLSGYSGGESWVRCSAAGRIEACSAGDALLIGRGEADGRVHLLFALPLFAELPTAVGEGVLVYNGTTGVLSHVPVAGKTQGDVLTLGLGLGISFATPTGGGGGSTPATLPLTGWQRGSFTGSPWTGTASAGSSGSRSFSEPTNPPAVGAALNGFTPADFDGVNDVLTLVGTADDLFNSAAGSYWVLFRADTATAPAGAGVIAEPFAQTALVSTVGNGFVILAFTTAGVTAGTFSGGYKAVSAAAATLTWNLAQVRWNSTTLEVRINSGAWQTVACGAVATLTASIYLGLNYDSTKPFDGRIEEFGSADTALTDTNFNDIKTYINARYALAL